MSQQPNTLDVLTRLAEVIESRKGGDPDKSYVARLFHKGTDTVLKKVGEEATETVMAGKDMAADPSEGHRKALVGELARREGLSGLEEFAARSKPAAGPQGA